MEIQRGKKSRITESENHEGWNRPLRSSRRDSALPEPPLKGMRSLLLIPSQAGSGASMGRADLPWRVCRTDEHRSSDETGKYLLSLSLTQILPLNHRLGLKTRGLCKHIACFHFEADNSLFSTKRLWVFFHAAPRPGAPLAQTRPVLGAGLGQNKAKNHRWETGAEFPRPVSACHRVGLGPCGFAVSLDKQSPARPTEMPDAARSSSPGSHGRWEPRGSGTASPKQSSVSCSTCENKRKEGESYPITHCQGSGAVLVPRPQAVQPQHLETGAAGAGGSDSEPLCHRAPRHKQPPSRGRPGHPRHRQVP